MAYRHVLTCQNNSIYNLGQVEAGFADIADCTPKITYPADFSGCTRSEVDAYHATRINNPCTNSREGGKRMKVLRILLISFLTLFFLAACVSKSKYVELEGDLATSQQQVEEKKMEIDQLEEKRKALEDQLAGIEKDLQEKDNQLQEKDKRLLEKEEVIDEMASTRRSIEANLKDQIESQQIKLENIEGKLKITFVDKILFNSGSAKVNQAGQKSLKSLAETLQQEPDQMIVVEGHTDDVKVGPSLQKIFPTNWELSTARATAVVRFLQEQAEIGPERLSAVGYSYYKPVASNDTEEGRAQNRRIEIILVPPR
jgi:chemotaxis protein MotB